MNFLILIQRSDFSAELDVQKKAMNLNLDNARQVRGQGDGNN